MSAAPEVRVGINLLYLLPGIVGGTETYAAALLPALEAASPQWRFVVFLNREAAGWPLPESPAFERVVCPVNATRRGSRYLFEQTRLPTLLRRHRVQLVHSLGYVGPLRTHCARVVTVHDLHYRQYPTGWLRRAMLEFFVGWSVHRADAVIVDSAFIGRELVAAFGKHLRRLTVVPFAARQAATTSAWRADARKTLALPLRYFVAFSSVAPNKNVPRLLAAFSKAAEREGLAQELVIVGHPPPTHSVTVPHGVRFTGYLPAEQADAVVEGAEGLIFPTFYEGFGLPVLEAMHAGVPVITSNRASLPEVGSDAALYVDPFDVEAIADRIAELARDEGLRDQLRERGIRRAGEFSWARSAEATLAVYRDVLQLKGGQPA
jgi:glycosyltransferase involved in cell wall biosynthesis